jgi:hypothetical protein
MRLAHSTSTAALLVLLAASAAQADPPELSGTYAGKGSCAGFNDGQPVKFKTDVTVTLDHASDDLIRGFFEFNNDVRPMSLEACGFVIGDAVKPERGRAALGAGNPPNEAFFTIDLAKAEVFPENRAGTSGQIKGALLLSIRSSDTMLSCKLAADRISTVDPNLTPCPAPSIESTSGRRARAPTGKDNDRACIIPT